MPARPGIGAHEGQRRGVARRAWAGVARRKDAVAVVVTDPCATYRAAVAQALPCAAIGADHFHLVRLANSTLTDVRRRGTRDTHGRRDRASDPACAAHRRRLRGYGRLSPEQTRSTRTTRPTPTQQPDHRLDRERGVVHAAGLRLRPAEDLHPTASACTRRKSPAHRRLRVNSPSRSKSSQRTAQRASSRPHAPCHRRDRPLRRSPRGSRQSNPAVQCEACARSLAQR